jgi:hypothetical protein
MIRFKVRRQAERAGIAPTLSVVVAGGVALEQVDDQFKCHVHQDDVYDEGNAPLNSLINQVIIDPLFQPQIGAFTMNFPLLFYHIGCQSIKRRTMQRWLIPGVKLSVIALRKIGRQARSKPQKNLLAGYGW